MMAIVGRFIHATFPRPTERRHLARYLADQLSLSQFLDWFIEATATIEAAGNPAELQDVIYTIKLYWAEYSNGDLTEAALRDLLRPLVKTANVSRQEVM